MTDSGKISVFQLCAIFTVCRITALFTFIAPRTTPFDPGDRLILFIPFFLFSALFALPVFLVTEDGGDLTSLTNDLSPVLTGILAVIYIAAEIWNAGVSTAKFELFMTTAMFSGAVLLPLTALMLLACVYIARRGDQTVGRCCVILLGVLLVSVFAVIASTAKDFDVLNLSRPIESGIWPLVRNGFSAAARTPETAALLFIQPKVNGNIKKGYFLWLALFGLFASAVLTAVAGVTGKYGDNQTFQLYTLTVLASFGPFEKADDVITGIWVLCSMFRTAFYISLASETAVRAFRIKNKYLLYFVFGAGILLVCFFLSRSVSILSGILASGVNEFLFALLAGVFPTIVYTASRFKRKRCSKRSNTAS